MPPIIPCGRLNMYVLAHRSHVHRLAGLPAEQFAVELQRRRGIGRHQFDPRCLADFRWAFRLPIGIRRLVDVEGGALRVGHHLHAADGRHLNHWRTLFAAELLDVGRCCLELRHADIHGPERRRVQPVRRRHDSCDGNFSTSNEHGVGLRRALEGRRRPAYDRPVERFGGLHVARHQFEPQGTSEQGRHSNSHKTSRAKQLNYASTTRRGVDGSQSTSLTRSNRSSHWSPSHE